MSKEAKHRIVCLLGPAVMLLADAAWAASIGKPPRNPAAGLASLMGLGVGITAFLIWGRATFPKLKERADRVIRESSTWRTFWVGLINAIVAFLLVVVAAKAGAAIKPVGLVAVAIIAGAAVVAFRGALGVWPEYGHRILGGDDAPSDLQATLTGGALLTGLLLLFPVGLVFFGYVLVRSLGAGVLLMVQPAAPAASD